MFSILEPLSAAAKASYEAELAAMNGVSHTALDGMSKIIDLNLMLVKTAMEDSASVSKQLMSAQTPQEWFSLAAALAQPNVEKALTYSRTMATIVSSTQAEIAKAAEEQIAETNHKVMALVDEVAKNAPTGSESAIAAVKSALDNAQATKTLLSQATQQTVDLLDSQLAASGQQLSRSIGKVASKAIKK